MKKIIIPLFILFLLILPAKSLALQSSIQQDINFTSSQEINDDFYAVGSNIILGSTIGGNVTVFGSKVSISGKITKNLDILGGEVTVSGKVGDTLRVSGGVVTLSGVVANDVLIAGGTVIIEKNAKIEGDLLVFGGTLNLDGTVEGSLRARGGILTISGTVKKDSSATFSQVRLISGARLASFKYKSPKEAVVDKSVVYSSLSFQKINSTPSAAERASGAFVSIILLISYLIFGLILIKIMPLKAKETALLSAEKNWKSFALGLIFIILLPILAIVALFTVVGLHLAIASLMLYSLILLLASIPVAIWIGEVILVWASTHKDRMKVSTALAFTLGLIIIWLLRAIPVIGGALSFIIACIGSGAIILLVYKPFTKEREKEVKE